MSQVLYQISPEALRQFLEQVAASRDDISAAAPVDSSGKFIDDGTFSDDQELLGIPVRVVTVDTRSMHSLCWDVHWDICDVVAAPAIEINDSWHVTHRTVAALAGLLDRLRALYARVHATTSRLAGEVYLPQDLTGVITGATSIPASLEDVDDWPTGDLPRSLRGLAALNYAAHRIEGHGKSWEPGIKIRRQDQQWQITFITYQFDDGRELGREHLFAGTWDRITEAVHTAAANIAQRYDLTPSGGDLEPDHPLARLSKFELLNLPDNVELHLAPGHLAAAANTLGVNSLLERFDAGMDPRALIEFARYATSLLPQHISVADAINWTGDRYTPDSEER